MNMESDGAKEWATYTLMEAPFWRDGMSAEEYEIERNYLGEHWTDVESGTYTPLWKQKQQVD